MRNLENFKDALVCQYRDLIHEAILESETDHKTRMDLGKLNAKLRVICKAAQYDGLSEDTISRTKKHLKKSCLHLKGDMHPL